MNPDTKHWLPQLTFFGLSSLIVLQVVAGGGGGALPVLFLIATSS
jgi:hypothetical protein